MLYLIQEDIEFMNDVLYFHKSWKKDFPVIKKAKVE